MKPTPSFDSTQNHSDLCDTYQREGYWIEPNLLTREECEQLKAESLQLLKAYARPGTSVLVGAASHSPLFEALARDQRVLNILSRIMPMSEGIAFLTDKIVYKSAEKAFGSPWHIDAFYWKNTRPKLSVWIPLDDSRAENGTLIVVPKSHLSDWGNAASGDTAATNGEFGQVISERSWKPEDEVICEIPRGSAIFFSDRLLHASCENTAGKDRYSIISTYHAPEPEEPFDLRFPARRTLLPARTGHPVP